MATRWGIASAGKISSDFVTALQMLPSSEHQVVAVGARSLNSSKEFSQRFNIPKHYGSYEELSKDTNIEIVYIAAIHPQHANLCKLMLQAGKHVLCEKPLCMNEREVREVLAVAKEKKLFLMEAFWSRCFPVYQKLQEELEKKTIGEPRVVTVSFGNNASHIDRLADRELGGGALLDMGCYTVQLADFVFGGSPDKISTVGTLTQTGVDDTSVTTLMYPAGQLASLGTSISSTLCPTACIQGTKGYIQIPEFWVPSEIIVKGETSHFPHPESDKPFNYHNSNGLAYEAQHVRETLLKGALESPLMPHSSSLNIIRILDEARRQLGVTYDADRI